MLTYTKTAFLSFVYLLAVARGARADYCLDGPADQIRVYGKKHEGGIGFCETQWMEGLIVTGIEVWANQWQIRGFQLTYSDGRKWYYGPQDGDSGRHGIVTWRPEDRITRMQVAKNKVGDGLGLVHIEVAGKTFEVRSEIGDIEEVPIASGILIGVGGSLGNFIYEWSPLFLGTMTKAVVTDMQFDKNLTEVNENKEGIEAVSLGDIWIVNDSPVGANHSSQTWEFSGEDKRTESIAASTMEQHKLGTGIKAEFGGEIKIPFIAKANWKTEIGVSYEYTNAKTKTNTESKEHILRWKTGLSQDGRIQPGNAKHCNATSYQGYYSGDYTSTVNITVNAKNYLYKERGSIETTSFTNAIVRCEDVPTTDVPEDGNVISASDTLRPKKRSITFAA